MIPALGAMSTISPAPCTFIDRAAQRHVRKAPWTFTAMQRCHCP